MVTYSTQSESLKYNMKTMASAALGYSEDSMGTYRGGAENSASIM